MALIKWEPRRELEPFRTLRGEIDRMFDDLFQGWRLPRVFEAAAPGRGEFLPSVDLKELEKEFVLTAELPGIRREELDVHITEDSVTLKGERKEEKEEEEKGYYLKESSYGSFQRVIPLPDEVVAEKAKATLKDGVLTLNLPKAEPSVKKRIQVKVE